MSEGHRLRVLVVEDEPLGYARITDLLAEHADVEVLPGADCCDDAVAAIRERTPDLVFLDVQLREGSGLDVVREVGAASMPVTIFVTAHDRYALDAFQSAAVDYLLKPYSDERFEEAFLRARRQIELGRLGKLREELKLLLSSGEESAASREARPGPRYLKRIAVQTRRQMRVVPVDRIDCITARGVYAQLHVGDERYIVRESLQSLEERLDPDDFFRIHRSTIVRLGQVQLLVRGKGGDYEVQLGNSVQLRVGRSRVAELKQRLGRI